MNRKKWSNEEKITIVLEMIKGVDSVSAICARHGVSATQAYKWQEQFLAGGRVTLSDKRRRGNLDPVAEENRHLKELVGQQVLVIEAQKKLNGVLPRR